MPNSKTKGDLTESMVIHELISRGGQVAIPFGDNAKYDLVVEDQAGVLHRIQCKTAWKPSPDTVRFNTHSQTTRDGQYHETGYEGSIDAFVARLPETETLYWVDIQDAPSRKMLLRYEAAIDHPAINWAADFELDEEIPPRRP
ncbi:MAG: group I intron-associated PD-(D/E)XK endonuclease [Halobacteriales archaeon]|nr:group I intron-associated PD-(D/E)XK endonuclease [Halobacteriales archaeon]